MFLDVEAEVDEDEEDVEEEDEDLVGEDGFIQEHDLEAEDLDAGDDRQHRDLDRQRQEITDKDAERTRRGVPRKVRPLSCLSVPWRWRRRGSKTVLPSVDDPSIGDQCKVGKERILCTRFEEDMGDEESGSVY